MSRRRWIILGTLLVVLTVGAELVVRPGNASKGCVRVINQGDATLDDLVASYGDTKVRVGQLGAGQSTNVWFSVAGKGTLTIGFNQKGNPMKGFQVQDYDPGENLRNEAKLVLAIKNNQIERFMDEDLSKSPLKNLFERVKEWFMSDPEPP